MTRKIKSLLILGILPAMLITGCTENSKDSEQSFISVLTSDETFRMDSLEDAYSMILKNSTRDFTAGYPIDESFLSWVAATYGEPAITEIAGNGEFSSKDTWYRITGNSIHVLWADYAESHGLYLDQDIHRVETKNPHEFVMDFTGDVNLAENMATTNYMLEQRNGLADCFSGLLLDEMFGADILMVNNEYCYSTRGEPLKGKEYTFRANPNMASALFDIGVDFVNLANNHVWDYGPEAMDDTIDTLDKVMMPHVGAGHNLSEAKRPLYYVANGQKIAVVSATQVERSYNYTKEATDDMPGVLKTLDPAKFVGVIEEAEKNADMVIAIVHWGTEGDSSYGNDQLRLAQSFVDAGADAIIGGHTHCLQGVEYMGNVPIYYSLGNYWFCTSGSMPVGYDTGLAQLRIGDDGEILPYFIPCYFDNGVTYLATDNKY
ncbi:MAG: CapA family protein, partial [Lachnospiraceae bacterium]|nr:CapA family protein [Lachnospiraceae bacterium]